jgi:two-component system, NarL family, nitrate/nitrite response regulator NarL
VSAHPISASHRNTLVDAIGILVIDDQPAVRAGLARLIACIPQALRFVSTAATGAEALRLAARLKPEVVVLDVDLGGEDGLAFIPQLAATARVLVLTSHGDAATRERAMRLGALAFVEKHRPAAELLRAIADMVALHSREEGTPGQPGATTQASSGRSSDAPAHPEP